MKRSTDRILTTHVGSLARPQELIDLSSPEAVADARYLEVLKRSVAETVRKEAEIGVDIISDGEFGKSNWQSYIMERVSGYMAKPVPPHKWSYIGKDLETFVDYYKEARPELFQTRTRWVCNGPIEYDSTQITRDIANFKAALSDVKVEEAFMPVIAPGSVALDDENLYYPSEETYVQAIAEALMHDILSVDGEENYLRWAELRIEGLNYALEGIPEERVRYHICWGSWHGPHTTDVPLRKIVNIILKAKVQAYSVEAANPRHEHEFQVWEDVKLPAGKVLIPGVITHRTPVVEHPDVVAMRILRYARIVGRENMLASSDCGFAQGTRTQRVHPSIAWAKLGSLVEGARRATQALWK
jgi:5-methyltetrahydropteroyltriglutamate--homocysteine methyltransferase